MKGFFIKDLKLLKMQKTFFLMIIAIAAGMAVLGEAESFSPFITAYVTFIGGLFTLSTISYDEFDNGYAFLFSLPITRREYVMEKYGFGIVTGSVFWMAGLAVNMAAGFMQGAFSFDTAVAAFVILAVMFLLLAVMLPFQLKFGGEKGRIAIIGAAGLLLIVGMLTEKAGVDLSSVLNHLPAVSPETAILLSAVLAAASLLVSYKISLFIINTKEF